MFSTWSTVMVAAAGLTTLPNCTVIGVVVVIVRVSEAAPVPPNSNPASDPPVARVKLSTAALPVRFSTEEKVTPGNAVGSAARLRFNEPLFRPEIFQLLSLLAAVSVSVPALPVMLTLEVKSPV